MKFLVFLILTSFSIALGNGADDHERSLRRWLINELSSESPTVSPAPSAALISQAASESPTVSPAPSTVGEVSLVNLFGTTNPPPKDQNSVFGVTFGNNPPPPPPKKKTPNALNSPWRNPGFTRSTNNVMMAVLLVAGGLGSFLGLTL